MNLRKYYPQGNVPWMDPETGHPTEAFRRFSAQQTTQPGDIAPVAPTGSPFSYTASESGSLHITGGAVSAVTLARASVTLATGMTSGFFPMSTGDIVKITYTVLPTVNFVPN